MLSHLLLFLAAQGGIISNSVSPPPAIVAVQPPTVTPILAIAPPEDAPLPAPFIVDVRVTGGGRTLFQGPLRLARGFQATFNQSLSQAPAAICPSPRRYDPSDRSSLRVQLSQWGDPSDQIQMSVDWARPSGSGCGQAGTRTVQLSQVVEIRAGQTVVVTGDAGLTVSLTRH